MSEVIVIEKRGATADDVERRRAWTRQSFSVLYRPQQVGAMLFHLRQRADVLEQVIVAPHGPFGEPDGPPVSLAKTEPEWVEEATDGKAKAGV